MPYQVGIDPHALRQLGALPRNVQSAIRAAIQQLAQNPRPPGCLRMGERPGWRVRGGQYRIIYEIDDVAQTVTILQVGHRRDVYHQ